MFCWRSGPVAIYTDLHGRTRTYTDEHGPTRTNTDLHGPTRTDTDFVDWMDLLDGVRCLRRRLRKCLSGGLVMIGSRMLRRGSAGRSL